jgi:hypothetical protein
MATLACTWSSSTTCNSVSSDSAVHDGAPFCYTRVHVPMEIGRKLCAQFSSSRFGRTRFASCTIAVASHKHSASDLSQDTKGVGLRERSLIGDAHRPITGPIDVVVHNKLESQH